MTFELSIAGALAAAILAVVSVSDPRQAAARFSVCIMMCALLCTYMTWRISTLNFSTQDGEGQYAWQVVFFCAEIVCSVEALLFFVQMSRVRDNTKAADQMEAALRGLNHTLLPSVDVWIATYDEEWSTLEKTIIGALNLNYPKEKLRILVLDDGRRLWLASKCKSLGVEHITRPDSRGKKAGNHNHALSICSAPFILSLDADFVPFPNFLFRTLGFFTDPEVAVVQTPQTYYNVDAMRSSMLLNQAPDELSFFYREEQPARDAWDSAFYCGSCAVLRRSALIQIGGFVTTTDIEDLATSVKLCANGFKARYLDETLSVGLSAESLAVLHDQRNRWCRGSLQVVFSSFGPFGRGLTLTQRMLFRQTHWVVWSIVPMLFFITPAVFWLFGWKVYSSTDVMNVFWLPLTVFIISALVMTWLTRMRWHPFLSPAMQLFLSIELIPTALTSLPKPFGRPLIRILPVTPKGSSAASKSLDARTFLPLACIIATTLCGFLYNLRHDQVTLQSPLELVGAMFWTGYAVAIGVLACLMCFERPYRRGEERFAVDQVVRVTVNGKLSEVHLRNISLTGGCIGGHFTSGLDVGQEISLLLPTIGYVSGRVVRRGDDGKNVGLVWVGMKDVVRHNLIRAIFTDPSIQEQGDKFSSTSVSRGLARRFINSP